MRPLRPHGLQQHGFYIHRLLLAETCIAPCFYRNLAGLDQWTQPLWVLLRSANLVFAIRILSLGMIAFSISRYLQLPHWIEGSVDTFVLRLLIRDNMHRMSQRFYISIVLITVVFMIAHTTFYIPWTLATVLVYSLQSHFLRQRVDMAS